jgi:transposase-like protein
LTRTGRPLIAVARVGEYIDAARLSRYTAGDRWFVEERYVKVTGIWTYPRAHPVTSHRVV